MSGVRGAWTVIARRELAAYFNSPVAYIFLFVFVALIGFLYMSQFFLVGLADMRMFFHFLPMILCVFLPAVTMRQWAEERKGNTYELLLTFPMPPHALVFGKFAASAVFYAAALAATLPIPVMLLALGSPDAGQIATGYIGAALLGAFLIAIGLCISGFCRDQIVAFAVSMVGSFLLLLIGTEFIASSIDGWLPGVGEFLRRYVGMTHHFAGFQKGVVDLRAVAYFVTGTCLALALNGFWIEGRMRPRQRQTFATAAALAAGIFVCANWFVGHLSLARFDFTEAGTYTVSPVTRDILSHLKSPVTVKYYVSTAEKMPTGLKTLEQDVLDKLDEFRLASRGWFQYKVFHMDASNITDPSQVEAGAESLEQRLQQKGVQPFQVQSVEADEVGVRLVYSAMAIAYKDKPEEYLYQVIPGNLEQLEYLLMSKVYRMTLPEPPSVAVVAPYEESSIDPSMVDLLRQLGQRVPESQLLDEYEMVPMLLESEGYQVRRIQLSAADPIPDGADLLAIFGPGALTEEQTGMIGRFLADGGSVLLAAQQYHIGYAPSSRGEIDIVPDPQRPGVGPLLEPLGLGLQDGFLIDENQEVLSVAGGLQVGPFSVTVPVKLPIHVRVEPGTMNQEVSITSRVSPMLYLWGSALSVDAGRLAELGLKVTTLMSSSRQSWVIPASVDKVSPDYFTPSPDDPRGPFPLAVLVEGRFPRTLGAEDGAEAAVGKLLLIGSDTMFQKMLIRQGGHISFLLNACDVLSFGEELVHIRSKQPVDRSLGRVSSLVKAWWRFVVTLGVPLLIVCVGALRIALRRRARLRYEHSLAG